MNALLKLGSPSHSDQREVAPFFGDVIDSDNSSSDSSEDESCGHCEDNNTPSAAVNFLNSKETGAKPSDSESDWDF